MTKLQLLYCVFYIRRGVFKALFNIIGYPTYHSILMHLYNAIEMNDGMFFREHFSNNIPRENILYIFEVVALDSKKSIVRLKFSYRYNIEIKDPRKRFKDFGKFSVKKFYKQNPNFKLTPDGLFKILFISIKALPVPPVVPSPLRRVAPNTIKLS